VHRCRADRRAAATSATPCAPARSADRGAVARSQPPASASSGAPQQPPHPRPPSTPSSHGTHAPSATSATGRSPRIGGLRPQGIMDPRAGRKGGPCTPLLIGSSSSFSLVSLKSVNRGFRQASHSSRSSQGACRFVKLVELLSG